MTQTNRRTFLATLAGGAALLAAGRGVRAARPDVSRARRLLILGGTGFLGPHVVQAAIHRGHDVTLFNRGRTNADLFPQLKKIEGNRDPTRGAGLRALRASTDRWDAVIDLSGYVPRHVAATAELLADRTSSYVFLSSINVYRDFPGKPGLDESAPLAEMDEPTIEKVTDQTLGPLKAECERAAQAAMSGRCLIIRPGLIGGPFDPRDLFTYWPIRIAAGGRVLAPGTPADPVQYIDARDLAWWIVNLIETDQTGAFNAVGPASPMTIAELLHGCKAVTGGNASLTWADAAFLETHGVQGYRGMPIWTDPQGPMAGVNQMSNVHAIDAGLRFRPLAQTVQDTMDWFATLPQGRRQNLKAGISPARERALLAAWDRRSS